MVLLPQQLLQLVSHTSKRGFVFFNFNSLFTQIAFKVALTKRAMKILTFVGVLHDVILVKNPQIQYKRFLKVEQTMWSPCFFKRNLRFSF